MSKEGRTSKPHNQPRTVELGETLMRQLQEAQAEHSLEVAVVRHLRVVAAEGHQMEGVEAGRLRAGAERSPIRIIARDISIRDIKLDRTRTL